ARLRNELIGFLREKALRHDAVRAVSVAQLQKKTPVDLASRKDVGLPETVGEIDDRRIRKTGRAGKFLHRHPILDIASNIVELDGDLGRPAFGQKPEPALVIEDQEGITLQLQQVGW